MNLRPSNHAVANRSTASTIVQEDGATMRSGDSRTVTLCLALLIATLWLATRPYMGVIHDSRFYTIHALSALLPGRFAEDLYFRYGSQDQFSLFSLAYKPIMAVLGIAKSNLILTVLGQCLWITGLVYLARGMVRDGRMALIAVAMAVALPGGPAFRYGEPFLTPRLFAEALTLWALGSMLRGRSVRALLLLSLSITVHPLMTLPGFAVLFFYEGARRRVWWVVGAIAIIASLGLASWGVQPFVRLLESFDPAWFAVVRVRDFFCLLTQWTAGEWLTVCNILVLAAIGLRVAEPHERRFLVAVLAVALGGLAVTLLGGDLLRNVLVVDIQPWRATWLLAVVAHLSVGPTLLRIRRSGASSFTGFAFVFAIGLLVVTGFIGPVYLVATPMAVVAWLVCTWEQVRQRTISATARLLGLVFVAVVCGGTVAILLEYMVYTEAWASGFWQTTRGIGLTALALGAIAVHVTASADTRRMAARPMIWLAMGLAAVAALGWDQRTPWTKFVDTADAPESLSSLLPDQTSVYWEGDVRVPWFVLKRPSYFSCDQGTGVLFSRGTAISYQHRHESFQPLRTLDFGKDSFCPSAEGRGSAPLSREDLASLCKKEPGLGSVVLTQPVMRAPGQVWVSPVKFEDVRPVDGKLRVFTTDRFFVYSCAALR